MAYEIETKVLDIDKEEVVKSLLGLGAQKVKETRLKVDWYRPIGTQEGQDPWFLRIRTSSEGIHEVTWKGKSDVLGDVRKHQEINFLVQDPEKLRELFEAIGLEKYAYQEKDRTSFSLKDWVFEIDQYPGIPAFLEVEGKSKDHVQEAVILLGLEGSKRWNEGERTLIQKVYGLDWYQMKF